MLEKKINEKTISFLGFYLFILGVFAVIYSLVHPEVANFLWLCYVSLIVIGLGMARNDSFLIAMQLNIIFIPILVWNIDFYYQLFTGEVLLGVSNYVFMGNLISFGKFVTLQHLYILPLTIYSLYKIKIKRKKIWIASFIEVIIVFFLSFFLTSIENNTNCVFNSCVDFIALGGISYQLVWFGIIFTWILFVNYFLDKYFFEG